MLRSSPNGLYLYNATSILLYGNESSSRKLRLLTSVELFGNADYCSEHPAFTRARKYSKYSGNSLFVLAISEATASNFNRSLKNKASARKQSEIAKTVRLHPFYVLWPLQLVLKRPVQSVYPVYRQFEYLNLINTTVNSRTDNQHSPIATFWTNTKSYSSAEIFREAINTHRTDVAENPQIDDVILKIFVLHMYLSTAFCKLN